MDPKLYFYIAQGMLTIDGVDDAEEMKLTDEAFDILNFKQVIFIKIRHNFNNNQKKKKYIYLQEEKLNLFKCTAAIMHWGNAKWKQRPREEQAEADGTEENEKVSYLLGIETTDLIKGLLKPRIKVNFLCLCF